MVMRVIFMTNDAAATTEKNTAVIDASEYPELQTEAVGYDDFGAAVIQADTSLENHPLTQENAGSLFGFNNPPFADYLVPYGGAGPVVGSDRFREGSVDSDGYVSIKGRGNIADLEEEAGALGQISPDDTFNELFVTARNGGVIIERDFETNLHMRGPAVSTDFGGSDLTLGVRPSVVAPRTWTGEVEPLAGGVAEFNYDPEGSFSAGGNVGFHGGDSNRLSALIYANEGAASAYAGYENLSILSTTGAAEEIIKFGGDVDIEIGSEGSDGTVTLGYNGKILEYAPEDGVATDSFEHGPFVRYTFPSDNWALQAGYGNTGFSNVFAEGETNMFYLTVQGRFR
jgi:hypothetical protein